MATKLKITIGQYSDKGRKEVNQDFHGACIPQEPLLGYKGIAVALADGISSSAVSHEAAECAVGGFLSDYYCTSEAWSVKTAGHRVLAATNSWLHAQNQRSDYRFDKNHGYVCTMSALIVKSTTAHLFHIGDARIYRVIGDALEPLTTDHRIVISPEQSYLGRALGIADQVEVEYRVLALDVDDIFVLATDGVYDHIDSGTVVRTVRERAADLDGAARHLVETAYAKGSPDNLTVQIVRIDELPPRDASEVFWDDSQLPLPALPEPGATIDSYRIVREIYCSSRSHLYLAAGHGDARLSVIKIPAIGMRDDPDHLTRFLIEDWIARRINNPHVVKPATTLHKRTSLYVAMEYIDGRTLAQWMTDNPRPPLESVRKLVEQIAKGLQAFHRLEMLHQDLRPDNIMIDTNGTAKIIDFGSTRVAGIAEAAPSCEDGILGTVQYMAPEYLLGEGGSRQADIFSLGVITYQMLTGRLPYGAGLARVRSRAGLNRLSYRPALADDREIPDWIDAVLKKSVHLDHGKRYDEVSAFVHDLRHPGAGHLGHRRMPLLDRDPVLFWKVVSALLIVAVIVLLAQITGGTACL